MTLKTIKDSISKYTFHHYTQKEFFLKIFPEDMLISPSGISGDNIVVDSDTNSSWLSKFYNDNTDPKSGAKRVRRILGENIRTNNEFLFQISSNCKKLLPRKNPDLIALVDTLISQVHDACIPTDIKQYLCELLRSSAENGLAACIVYSCCQIDNQVLLTQLQKTYGHTPILPLPHNASLDECLNYLQNSFWNFYMSVAPDQCSSLQDEHPVFDLHTLNSCQYLVIHLTQACTLPLPLIDKISSICDKVEFIYYEKDLHPANTSDIRLLGKKFEKIIELESELKELRSLIHTYVQNHT